MNTNILFILPIERNEHPNDLVLEWLLNPQEGHGVPDFAASIIRHLWEIDFSEPVKEVKRQCSLGDKCVPDITVRFERALLVVENKVKAGSLTQGQLERQHQFATEQQKGRPLYHVLVCPDRLSIDAYGVSSSSFKTLRYSVVAQLLEASAKSSPDTFTQHLVRQYAEYVMQTYGSPPRVRPASPSQIAGRRTREHQWSEQEFMQEVAKTGDAQSQAAQANLLDLFNSMDGVAPKFDGKGRVLPTYRVYLGDTEIHFLRVISDGNIVFELSAFEEAGRPELASHFASELGPLITSTPHSPTLKKKNIRDLDVEEVESLAIAVQSIADKWSGRTACEAGKEGESKGESKGSGT